MLQILYIGGRILGQALNWWAKSCVLILTSPNSDLPGLKRICRLAFRLLSITAVVADVSGTPQRRGSLCDATTWACRVSGISDSSWFGVWDGRAGRTWALPSTETSRVGLGNSSLGYRSRRRGDCAIYPDNASYRVRWRMGSWSWAQSQRSGNAVEDPLHLVSQAVWPLSEFPAEAITTRYDVMAATVIAVLEGFTM